MDSVKWAVSQMPKTDGSQLPVMTLTEVQKARAFHGSFPQYTQTSLAKLDHMTAYLRVNQVFVKDESHRFDLNAFKVLGGSFAVIRYIAKETGKDVSELPHAVLTSDKLRGEFGQATFFTATDDNHGRGVAWAVNYLGQKAVVHMPKGTTQTRLENIKKEGASVDITGVNYDDCVHLAAKETAETERDVVIQDTAWDGYKEIPAWIMQGYGTMAAEASEQLKTAGYERPTHVFVQTGVGSLAGAVAGYFTNLYPDNPPTFVVVKANVATCLYKGAATGDGKLRIVGGDMQTIIAGLACGEPNTISWDILKNHVKVSISAPDWITAKGMRMLGVPIKGDPQVISGESGATPSGALAAMMTMEEYKKLRNNIGLDENSEVLFFSTEGGTGPERYKNIIWEGKKR